MSQGIVTRFKIILNQRSEACYNHKGVKYIKNEYIFEDDYVIIVMRSKKFGINYAYVDLEDFELIKDYNWYANKKDNTFYCQTMIYNKKKRKHLKMHRLIMDCPRNLIVDHIDRNGLNNRKYNLRKVSESINNKNRKSFKGKDKKLPMGVRYNKKAKSYVSSWYDNDGERHFKVFSKKKYGSDAIHRAIYHRYIQCLKYGYILDNEFMEKVKYRTILKIRRL